MFLTTSHEENVNPLGPGGTPRSRGSSRTPTSRSACSPRAVAAGRPATRPEGAAPSAGAACRVRREDLDPAAATGPRRHSRTSAPGALRAVGAPHGPRAGCGLAGSMAQVIGVAIELGGMPVPRGGGVQAGRGAAGIIRDAGGACETGHEVERVVVEPYRATGVRTAAGEAIEAARAVLAGVTPSSCTGSCSTKEAPSRRGGSATDGQMRSTLRSRSRRGGRGPAARADSDRPPDSGAQRRVARRGRPRAVARRYTWVVGDLMASSTPVRSGNRARWILWIQLQDISSRPVGGYAAGELDVARRHMDGGRCGRHTPTGSRPGSRRHALELPASILLAGSSYSPADHRGGEPEHARRRYGLRLVCARSEPDLAPPAAGSPGHRTSATRLAAHRRQLRIPGRVSGAGSGTLVAKALLR